MRPGAVQSTIVFLLSASSRTLLRMKRRSSLSRDSALSYTTSVGTNVANVSFSEAPLFPYHLCCGFWIEPSKAWNVNGREMESSAHPFL